MWRCTFSWRCTSSLIYVFVFVSYVFTSRGSLRFCTNFRRYAVAKKLARAQAGSMGEGEERGMRRAAAAAGLEWDDDTVQG